MSDLLSFPDPVNEKAARTVAGVVLLLAIVTLATSAYWLLVLLAYGFLARVLTGPTLSPLGRLASAVIAPRMGAERPVPGPPKRFAQGIGATLTTVAAIAALLLGAHDLADALLVILIIAAGLESIFAVCLGCELFGLLMRAGLIPARVCPDCADIRGRTALSLDAER
jgi:HAMP domain-containing protein